MSPSHSRKTSKAAVDATAAQIAAPPNETQTESAILPDRTKESIIPTENSVIKENEAAGETGEISKSATKKAAKQAKLAVEKAEKASKPKDPKPVGKAEAKQPTGKAGKKRIEGAALIGIDVAKEDDFSGWYQQVLLKGDMIDYYDVSGCYILKPASYFIWEEIQNWFNIKIKSLGVKNCSFPMFISEDVLEKEKDHIEGFAPEVAWVTHA